MLFSEMKLQDTTKAALAKNGYVEPTQIQKDVIELAMSGRNIVGQSQTGTGKTAAFVIPLLELIDGRVRRPQAVILAPTRELASQIRDEVFKLSEGMRIRSTVIYGGSSFKKQREAIDMGPQIVIATPGRLIDLIDKWYIDLNQVRYFVLDECDRMLDMGFVEDIDYIWGHLPKVEQSMTFSATIPQEMQMLLSKYVGTDYENIKSTQELTVAKIEHSFIEVEAFDKFNLLRKYIEEAGEKKIIVFSRTKHETEHLARVLVDNGFKAGYLHGDLEQRQRNRALRAFKDNEIQVFVTTDVAARGLNMNNIDLVINYNVPEDPEAYIHRIGRTGRAGAEGKAVMFVSPGEKMMLRNVEKRNKITINQVDVEGNPVVRVVEDARTGFGGRGRGGRSGGGRGGYRGRSGGGSRGGYEGRSGGFGGDSGAPRSGGYAGHSSAPREGGYAGRSQGGRDGGGGYSGGRSGGGSAGGGYGRDSGRSGGGSYSSAPAAPRRPAGGGGSAGGDFSVFGG